MRIDHEAIEQAAMDRMKQEPVIDVQEDAGPMTQARALEMVKDGEAWIEEGHDGRLLVVENVRGDEVDVVYVGEPESYRPMADELADAEEIDEIVDRMREARRDHEHVFGPWQRSRLAGTYHRPCTVPGCKAVSLDDDDV